MIRPARASGARGASLLGILMIVVVLGGLAALGFVGVSSLTDSNGDIKAAGIVSTPTTARHTPSKPTGGANPTGGNNGAATACAASADAAHAASAVFYLGGAAYPTKWTDMTTAVPPNFTLPAGVIINPANPAELEGKGWTLTMSGGGTTDPTFTCGAPQ